MRGLRYHRKVWIAWGSWWAAQLYVAPYVSLGLHLDLRRPYLDLHVGWLILAVGRFPVVTDEGDLRRHSCRGFVSRTDPVL